jgi:tetratricopeptide (TPR) repeat protein
MMAGLGAALYASGLYEQAAERLCAASDLQPSDTAPYLFLGKMLQASPRTFPCAEKKLSRFLHDQPENAMANYYCALAIWKSSESADKRSAGAQVEPLLRKSLRIDPNFAEAYLQLGLVYSAEGQAKKAIDALEKAIGANPNLPEAHLRLGQECKKFGDSIRANAEFQKYAELTKTEAAELERQRRAIQQFVVVFQDQSARP